MRSTIVHWVRLKKSPAEPEGFPPGFRRGNEGRSANELTMPAAKLSSSMLTELDAKSSTRSPPLQRPRQNNHLAAQLVEWFRRYQRPLPWRATSDPYRIWISEVMLQQTRAAAVEPYYARFLTRFPDLQALAASSESELLECWSGLGYYSRARNLRRAAQHIVSAMGGRLPQTYEQWITLPGIGSYTAAAVASIAFGEPVAVLDGNVARVMARVTNTDGDIRTPRVRGELRRNVQTLVDDLGVAPRRQRRGGRSVTPGELNQALMELGATVCLLRNPRCLVCPVASHCKALQAGAQNDVPVMRRPRRQVRLEIAVAIVEKSQKLLLRQRPSEGSLMPGFWELPQAEGERLDGNCMADLRITLGEQVREFPHSITWHDYRVKVFRAALRGASPAGYHWVPISELGGLPLTTITRKALEFRGAQPK